MNQVQAMNPAHERITNKSAALGLICPDGISLIFVRGFLSSKLRSIKRLKAIAALRAVIMQPSINKNSLTLKGSLVCLIARKKPIRANGKAKIVWLNLTSEKYFAIAFKILT